MFFFQKKRAIVLAPHVDDAEFGCGGTISKISKSNKGLDIFYVTFSFAEKSLINGYTKEDIELEMFNAARKLGIKKENMISKDYEVREFPRDRQKILEDLIEIRKSINPDVVFMPSSFDTHQDHRVIHEEGFRAFKNITIFGYECLANNISFKPGLYVSLREEDIINKIESIKCYNSQIIKKKNSFDFIKSLAEVRGYQINSEYAEAFEVIRIIL